MATEIVLGTSGFSYDDWKGPVYPRTISRNDMLTQYCTHLPMVELNYTYYRMPKKENLLRMVERTPEGFQFIVKAHGSLTHEETKGRKEDLKAFKEGVEPLKQKGRLACILLQFPYSFYFRTSNLFYLEHLSKHLRPLPLAVEFRNGNWLQDSVQTWLAERNLAYVAVDMPRLPGLLPPVVWVTAPFAYLRFHGRNDRKWWKHKHAYERYDYSYSQEELKDWVETIKGFGRNVNTIYITFNNHYQGQSFRNALDMANLLKDLQDITLYTL